MRLLKKENYWFHPICPSICPYAKSPRNS